MHKEIAEHALVLACVDYVDLFVLPANGTKLSFTASSFASGVSYKQDCVKSSPNEKMGWQAQNVGGVVLEKVSNIKLCSD